MQNGSNCFSVQSMFSFLVFLICGLGVLGLVWAQGAPQNPQSEVRWPQSQRLAKALDHPRGITSVGDQGYFVTGGFQTGDNGVKRIPIAGGVIENLAVGDGVTTGVIATDGKWIYWGNVSSRKPSAAASSGGTDLPEHTSFLLGMPLSGGTPVVLASLPARAASIAVDDANVYVATSSRKPEDGQIVRVPKGGGASKKIVAGYAGISGIAADQSGLYFTTPDGIFKADANGSSPALVLAGQRQAIRLSADTEFLYFYSEQSGGRWDLFKLAKSGGAPVRIAANVHSNMDFALSESSVYFFQETRATYAGQITVYALRRVPKLGGDVETIDTGEIPSGKLVVAGDYVLFTDINSVYRVKK